MKRTILLVILIMTSWCHAGDLENQAMFKRANESFAQANAEALVNPSHARDLYQSAILNYEFLIEQRGINTADLHTNLGNAYFSVGDRGRAVLNYQRALSEDPLHQDVLHNLRYVRSLTIDALPMTRGQAVRHALTFWHRWSFAVRATCLGGAHVAFWGLVALMFYRRSRWMYGAMMIAAALSLLFGLSLLTSQQRWDDAVDGVVVEREVIARQGNGLIYDNAFTSPIHAGTEFFLIEQRGDWCHAMLLNGDTCWLSVHAVAWVERER
ncbi:MAG: tetratricopeptide repeat protein [Verrucomicrobiae bacterium]|nr:tetratricopeptide repeat protein [Verrucomicrobiae bacterium]NNJ43437.1 hypothetical protein [Akkermansiaceae bacterium]